jgi:N-acetylglucosaminyldiphosphoundecaprenol N-acetyl-beta-D-mannosaminyltransferase
MLAPSGISAPPLSRASANSASFKAVLYEWAYTHLDALEVNGHIGTIGAVFDFFAGTVERAPVQWQEHGLEWLYRLIKEPRRMWRRYIIGNALFLWNITKEKFSI